VKKLQQLSARDRSAFTIIILALFCSSCSQRFAVTLNDQTLYDPRWEIEILDGIAALTTLQFLDLSDNRISSLAPLQPLRNLSSVSILNNRVTDIAPLLSMLTLTSATLTGNDNIQCSQLDVLSGKLGQNLRRPADCRD
jgi:Leucine-rich repeat (LRR) protein